MPYIGKQPARTAIDASDIPDDSITAAKIVDGAITIADIADDAVTEDKLANAINTAIAANTAKVTNATHTGDVTGSGALTIANDAVDSQHYAAASIDNEHLADDAVGIAELSATGTASSSTFLRGDNSWTAVSTPITALNNATANELVTVGSTTTELDAESGLTFDGNNLTIANGNLILGTAGKGIDFAANANSSATGASTTSEILDDYEEGTWTPTLFGSGGGTGSWNAAYDHGSYTKVGRLVTFNAYTIASSLGDMSNATRIGGLPFTVSATGGYFTANFSGAQGLDIDAGDSLTGFININSDWILVQLWNATTGTAAYGFYIEELSADGGFIISGQYFTDS